MFISNTPKSFNEKPYVKEPVKPVLFIKTPNTRNSNGGVVVKPQHETLQAGPALGVVIGKSTSRVKEVKLLTILRVMSLSMNLAFLKIVIIDQQSKRNAVTVFAL